MKTIEERVLALAKSHHNVPQSECWRVVIRGDAWKRWCAAQDMLITDMGMIYPTSSRKIGAIQAAICAAELIGSVAPTDVYWGAIYLVNTQKETVEFLR
jgi:hypothetical protein